ncbi:hypothetical protein GCM10029976_042850 [Kribbella albertanoniae]
MEIEEDTNDVRATPRQQDVGWGRPRSWTIAGLIKLVDDAIDSPALSWPGLKVCGSTGPTIGRSLGRSQVVGPSENAVAGGGDPRTKRTSGKRSIWREGLRWF